VTDPTPAPKRVTAMDLRVAPVTHAAADAVIQREHYSGKTVSNSQLHFGVFIGNKIEGAMQFGPSMDKRKIQILVRDTPWNGFLELNRMAFSERLPRNSESRAIGIALRLIRKAYPHIQWVVSFADGTQCGDGTIYRASNFLLTGVKESTQIVQFPDGARYPRLVLTDTSRTDSGRFLIAHKYGVKLGGGASLRPFLDAGATIVPGFMLRYIYLLDPTARERLTVPVLPFSAIDEAGARMYRGQPRGKQATSGDQPESGVAATTLTLHPSDRT
jgi:hypothetical protein